MKTKMLADRARRACRALPRRLPTSRVATTTIRNAQLSTRSESAIVELLEQVAAGKTTPQAAAKLCQQLEYDAVGDFAKIDTKRMSRTGFPEVVYAEGKTSQQVADILVSMTSAGVECIMATRVTAQAFQEIHSLLPPAYQSQFEYSALPRILASKQLDRAKQVKDKSVCVLAAGTSDLPVAEEAVVTLQLAGFKVVRLYDVGVAGIHRILKNQHILNECDVGICVAGMDGALPGVVGGLTDIPIIAVPTSVGYGAAFGGLAPLLTMLNACSPGVGVVNIDNGFGAAVLAARILNKMAPSKNQSTSA